MKRACASKSATLRAKSSRKRIAVLNAGGRMSMAVRRRASFLDRCRRAAALPSARGADRAVPASFTCCEDPAISGCAAAGLASPCGIMAGMKKLAIIGGGAAGLAAAVEKRPRFARSRRCPGSVETTVYEASDRVGRSILATGNGRCNFSNACIDVAAYRNPTFVSQALAELEADPEPELESHEDPVHNLFADLGLLWREEGEGRLYPLANKATSVLDVALGCAGCGGASGVRLRCQTRRARAARGRSVPYSVCGRRGAACRCRDRGPLAAGRSRRSSCRKGCHARAAVPAGQACARIPPW